MYFSLYQNFNSIKVRLKLEEEDWEAFLVSNFNSIKVRLKHDTPRGLRHDDHISIP